MIITIVRFPLPDTMTAEQAGEAFQASAHKYEGLPGLMRKHYLFQAGTGGGVYFWTSREAAEKLYTTEWREGIAERFGSPPDVAFFDNPVTVDNVW